jgi:antitoxin component YwqK of YwqJK toxin-antitoxin module
MPSVAEGGIAAHLMRTSWWTYIVFLLPMLCFMTSCERRQQVINEGDYIDSDSVTVLHWKEYIVRDSFFREVTLQGKIVNHAVAENEQSFRDSSFSETDFYGNGKEKATRNFAGGVQKGIWKTWYEDGTKKSSSLVDNGVLRDYYSYYDNGTSAVTASRQPDGMMSRTERWRNGNLKEEFLTDSLGNGRCKNYHPNGMKSDSGALFRFAPSDTWMRWDSLGNSLSDTTYGKPVTF